MKIEAKKVTALVHSNGSITTETGWLIGTLADIVDYDQLGNQEKVELVTEYRLTPLEAVKQRIRDATPTLAAISDGTVSSRYPDSGKGSSEEV